MKGNQMGVRVAMYQSINQVNQLFNQLLNHKLPYLTLINLTLAQINRLLGLELELGLFFLGVEGAVGTNKLTYRINFTE
jgi:hypothetical protein